VQSELRHHSVPQLVFGLIIVVVGILLTLDTLGIADAEYALRYWPAGIVAIGLAKLWQSRDGRGGAFAGTLLAIVGAALLLEASIATDVELRTLWPLLIVLLGASLVWRSIVGRRAPAGDANATLSAVAVLGGMSRGNNSRTFRGGDLTAVMGGCEVDLRQAAIDGEAVLDVFAMWGGIEIRVPEDWTVIVRVTPLLGGVEDKTRPPQGVGAHRLVVRGFVIMAGVEIRN
jgi:predicted membrane protein